VTDQASPTLAREVVDLIEGLKAEGKTTAEAYAAAAAHFGRTNAEIHAARWMRNRDTAEAFPKPPGPETDIALLRGAAHALAELALEQLERASEAAWRHAEEAQVAAEQMAAYTDAKKVEVMRQLEEME